MDQELLKAAGFGQTLEYYKELTIDNGTDIKGTGATGDFMFREKMGDKWVKQPYANQFSGSILMVRAIAESVYKTFPEWKTEEFNLLDKGSNFAIFPLYQGKKQKDAMGNVVFYSATWVKTPQGVPSLVRVNKGDKYEEYPNGRLSLILYIQTTAEGIEDTGEVVKLKLKGGSLGKYFSYSNEINKTELQPFEMITDFSTEKDEKGYFVVKFGIAKNSKGEPKKVEDVQAVTKKVVSLITASPFLLSANRAKSLPGAIATQVDHEVQEEGVEADIVDVEPHDVNKTEKEVDIDDFF